MEVQALHPDAVGLTLLRALDADRGRAYSAAVFSRGWEGANRCRRKYQILGWIRDDHESAYGMLAVINAGGDNVQDYAVPDARAFQRIKRDLALVVESEDGTPEPAPTYSRAQEIRLREAGGEIVPPHERASVRITKTTSQSLHGRGLLVRGWIEGSPEKRWL